MKSASTTESAPRSRPKTSVTETGKRGMQPLAAKGDRSNLEPNSARLLRSTRAVADATRLQVLVVLQSESFGVQELCRIVALAQPALSHHLKLLHEAQLLVKRREGNTIYYRRASVAPGSLEAAIFAHIDQLPPDGALLARMHEVQETRRRQGQAFFTNNADALTAQQTRICDSSVYADAALGMVSRYCNNNDRALEVGPGDGHLAQRLSVQFGKLLGIDHSANMLEQTARALAGLQNVQLRCQEFEKLGKRNRFDLIMASMVVHHAPSPAAFFGTAAQLLSKQGVLLVAELCSHEQQWARDACGDLWLGFDTQDLEIWASDVGLACTEQQFLAQRNGFRIQLLAFTKQNTRRTAATGCALGTNKIASKRTNKG